MFEHIKVDLGYSDLDCETKTTGRKYFTPEGKSFPSITTVLGSSDEKKKSLEEWRERVGEEEAEKIGFRAANRGTAVHNIIEDYLNNVPDYKKGYMPNVIENFVQIRPFLNNISQVYALEAPLYSEYLGVAGRVDCVAVYNGKLSIIDFKTSAKNKIAEWIQDYFIQESFYAIAWEERTKMPITQLVTIMSVDTGPPKVFIEHRDTHAPKLLERIKEYKDKKMNETKPVVEESSQYENFVGKKVVIEEPKKSSLADYLGLEDEEKEWKKEWVGMPEYEQEDNPTYKTISMHFRNKEDYEEFAKLIEQPLTMKTKSTWYPRLDRTANSLMRWMEE